MAGSSDLQLSNAWVETSFNGAIHCYFRSPEGRVPCLLTADAVAFMSGPRGEAATWQIISSRWCDELAAIAEEKLMHGPHQLVTISAADLEGYFAARAPMAPVSARPDRDREASRRGM